MASGRENETWAGELTAADGCVKRVHLSSGQQWSAAGSFVLFGWFFFFPRYLLRLRLI